MSKKSATQEPSYDELAKLLKHIVAENHALAGKIKSLENDKMALQRVVFQQGGPELISIIQRIDAEYEQQYNQFMSMMNELSVWEANTLYVMNRIDTIATLAIGHARIAGLIRYGKGLAETYRNYVNALQKYDQDVDHVLGHRAEMINNRLDAINRAVRDCNEDGSGQVDENALNDLIKLATDPDPHISTIYQIWLDELVLLAEKGKQMFANIAEQERLKLEAEQRQKHVTAKTKQDQRLRAAAIEELRRVRPKRPNQPKPRVREFYIVQCEALIEAGVFPEDKREVYEYIKKLADSTLYTWEF